MSYQAELLLSPSSIPLDFTDDESDGSIAMKQDSPDEDESEWNWAPPPSASPHPLPSASPHPRVETQAPTSQYNTRTSMHPVLVYPAPQRAYTRHHAGPSPQQPYSDQPPPYPGLPYQPQPAVWINDQHPQISSQHSNNVPVVQQPPAVPETTLYTQSARNYGLTALYFGVAVTLVYLFCFCWLFIICSGIAIGLAVNARNQAIAGSMEEAKTSQKISYCLSVTSLVCAVLSIISLLAYFILIPR